MAKDEQTSKRENRIILLKAYLDNKHLSPFKKLLMEKTIEHLQKGVRLKKVDRWAKAMKQLWNKEL